MGDVDDAWRAGVKYPVLRGSTGLNVDLSNRMIWTVMLVISLAWGTSPVAVRIALREGFGPLTIAAGSSIISGAAVFALMAAVSKRIRIRRIELRIGLVLSVLSVLVPFYARNMALDNASAGFVALISALIPLVTAVMAHFALAAERLKLSVIAGLLLGLGGVAVLLLGGDSGIAEGGAPPVAGMFGMLSVLGVSAAAVYAKRYAGQYSVLAVTGVQLAVGGVALTLLALAAEELPAGPSTTGVLGLFYAGSVGTFVPLALYYMLIRYVTVTYSTIIGYIIPFVAVFTGVAVLDEQLQPGIVIGGLLVLLGVVVTDLVRIRDSRRQSTRQAAERDAAEHRAGPPTGRGTG